MKFSNYILLSMLFHLLFFSIMGAASSGGPEREEVFNVDLVELGPIDIKRPEPVVRKQPPPRARRRPPAKNLPPTTMFDEEPALPPGGGESETGTLAGKRDHAPLPDTGIEEAEPGKGLERPYLFDREIIQKYARRSPEPDKGLSFDTPEFRHRGYMRRLRGQIESIWEYPPDAVRNKLSGDLYITFIIKRNGELGGVEVVRTSGYLSLDRAAVKALKDAAPFWPLPDDWPGEELEIKGHFIYIYGRTFVM